MAKSALQKIRDQYEQISKEDLSQLAHKKCQKVLGKLYQTNIQSIKDLEKKSKEVEDLKKKIENFTKKEIEIAKDYLGEFPELKAMVLSDTNKEDLKKKAAAKPAESGNGDKRVSWTPYSIVQQLTKEKACDEGWLSYKALKGNFNAPSIDVLVKRFQSDGKDMLKKMEKGGESVAVQVSKEFKVKKKAGVKAFDYYFNKQAVIDRLMAATKYKEEAEKVKS